MGREIRRVVANWEHPKQQCRHSPWAGGCDEAKRNGGQCYHPSYDRDFQAAAQEWRDGLATWEGSERAKLFADEGKDYEFWEWEGGPPDREYYRPAWKPEEMTWFQVYETVSEGTPVTPPFATQEELIDYLVTNGDFWDQQRGDGGWSRENAETFVGRGFAMSMTVNAATGEIKSPRDGA